MEEVASLSELFGVLLTHAGRLGCVGAGSVEGVVVTSKISLEFQESLNNEFLNFTALGERVARGELEATDGTASSAAGSQDVLASRINLGIAEVIGVHVSGMSVPWLVTVVSLVNDVIK